MQKNVGAMEFVSAPAKWGKPNVITFFYKIMLNPWFFDPPSEILRYIYKVTVFLNVLPVDFEDYITIFK